MSKRSRNNDNENEHVKKFFSTYSKNLNSQINREYDNQMDIYYDSNSDDSIMTDNSSNGAYSSAKVVVVKESQSSEILSLDFYPGLHRHIINKIGW
ncbi:hypothetical protein BCR36DRAFT_586479 [Piromyces finnis]|uniref:Uncharacterized protein n=1 Tax=Piromyces finnis TaxID=1754191 RepID=A0A1Y1UYX6_9FUNG|nr:hypothetical protein BCR36DRAFT_586479 [Piromyces finnis]|eukprot:ORX43773.1 hypothetical protein BCR36DRAFT_586479 [Piromyces finnis]